MPRSRPWPSPCSPPRRAPGLIGPHEPLLPEGGPGLEGVAEETRLDVIRKMDEVYSQLVTDEIALEGKNAELEFADQATVLATAQAVLDHLRQPPAAAPARPTWRSWSGLRASSGWPWAA